MACHLAVPGHQQIPTVLKYSKIKDNLQVHDIFRLSTAFGDIIHDRRKRTSIKQRTLTKRWRHIEPQRNEDQQCARNYQHHPRAF